MYLIVVDMQNDFVTGVLATKSITGIKDCFMKIDNKEYFLGFVLIWLDGRARSENRDFQRCAKRMTGKYMEK